MNKSISSLMAAALLTTVTVFAQNSENDVKKETGKAAKKEIIIEEKTNGKNEKMVILIDGDKVTINGKPAEDYKGKKHIVIDDDIFINGDEVHIPGQGSMHLRGFNSSNRAMLGVVTEKRDNGAAITEVTKESAAENAGLKPGDVITKLNDNTIQSQEDLVAAIGKLKPKDAVDIHILRNGKERTIKAVLGKADAPTAVAWSMSPDHFNFKIDPPMAMIAPKGPRPFVWNDNDMWMFKSDRPKYGMSIEDDADGDGAKITGVEDESNAMKAGLKENDIITEVEGIAIKNVNDLKDALGDIADKSTIAMKVLRNGATENITVRVPKLIQKTDL